MKIIIAICVLFISGVFLQARIITVDNKYPSMCDYTNLQDAHDAANSGDTIYVYPSSISYDTLSANKKIILIGTGWETSNNYTYNSTITGTIKLLNGADYSKIIGFTGSPIIWIDADNTQILRNKLGGIIIFDNHLGTVIQNNIIKCNVLFREPYFRYYTCMYIAGNNSIIMSNNIIDERRFDSYRHLHVIVSEYGDRAPFNSFSSTENITLTMNNNFFLTKEMGQYQTTSGIMLSEGSNSLIAFNNIHHAIDFNYNGFYYPYASNCIANFCGIKDWFLFPNENGNNNNVQMSDVFVNWDPNNLDNCDFHLKPNSPAKGTGRNGEDMGIYGGSTPFVDGGYPGIPSIIELDADIVGSKQSGIKVKIKAKSNKD
ncbi:hypothetical protein ACFLSQ_05955 [Bacteroidota bacterium]